MEDTWDLEAGVEGPPGVRDVERPHSHRGNWRGPPRPGPAGPGARRTYNRQGSGGVTGRESEGVVVVRDRESRSHGEGPLLGWRSRR